MVRTPPAPPPPPPPAPAGHAIWSEYGMDWVETIQSSPNPRATDPNPVQSSWWPRIWIQSSPIRTQQNRHLPNTFWYRHVNTNDDVYSWRFEGRTSDLRVTIRRNCLKSLNMGYTLHISGSSPIQNLLSWWIPDPVQSKSAWTGLDYESSGLIQSIPYTESDYHSRPQVKYGRFCLCSRTQVACSFMCDCAACAYAYVKCTCMHVCVSSGICYDVIYLEGHFTPTSNLIQDLT